MSAILVLLLVIVLLAFAVRPVAVRPAQQDNFSPGFSDPVVNPDYRLGAPFSRPSDCNPMDPTGKIHDLPPVRYDQNYPSTLPRSNSMLVKLDPDATFQRLM